MTHKNKSAFSLMEMSAVIAIMTILISSLIIGGAKLITRGRLTAARAITKSSPVSQIPNLVLWLEATSPDSFITTEIYSSTKTISTWYDINQQSYNYNNATQSTTANQPTYVANAINNLPAIQFNGSAAYLNYDGTPIVGSDYTIFVVEQRLNSNSNNYFLGGGTIATDSALHLGYRNNNTFTHAQFGDDYSFSINSYTTPIAKIHAFTQNSSAGEKYYFSSLSTTPYASSASTTPFVSYVNAKIGLDYGSDYYTGNIGEIIIFNRTLTDVERQDVIHYLSVKWKITLT